MHKFVCKSIQSSDSESNLKLFESREGGPNDHISRSIPNNLIAGYGVKTKQTNIKNKQATYLPTVSSEAALRKNPCNLRDIESRIFKEVISLISDIDALEKQIITQKGHLQILQNEYPEVSQKVQYHNFNQRLTARQMCELQQENDRLLQQIQSMLMSKHKLKYMLQMQSYKFDELKQQYQKLILKHTPNNTFKQIKILEQENQRLSLLVLANLKQTNLTNQQKELELYLQNQQKDRLQFFDELVKIKQAYKLIKSQNIILKRNLQQKRKPKQCIEIDEGLADPSFSSYSFSSNIGKIRQNIQLEQYQSFIKMMQNTTK